MGPPDQQPPGSGPPDPRRGQLLALMLASAVFLWLVSPANPTVSVNEIETAAANVKMWALKFGMDVSVSCAAATCSKKIKENYNQLQATVEWVKGSDLQKEMGIDVQNMMAWKAEVVKKIREVAEQAVLKHKDEPDIKIRYNNAKKMYDSSEGPPEEKTEEWNEMTFTPHRNYDGTAVNMMTSALHIPTNVFDKSPDVLNAIKWSEELNPTFKNNIAFDPSLSWQFFGSSTGFLRLYPAIRWRVPEGPDMYDCRMRSWYIQAAASAKDIVILLDGSGSMTGLRKEIARNVVLNILETLSDNDFVTILRVGGRSLGNSRLQGGTDQKTEKTEKTEITEKTEKIEKPEKPHKSKVRFPHRRISVSGVGIIFPCLNNLIFIYKKYDKQKWKVQWRLLKIHMLYIHLQISKMEN